MLTVGHDAHVRDDISICKLASQGYVYVTANPAATCATALPTDAAKRALVINTKFLNFIFGVF